MSRGHGKIQHRVLELLSADEPGLSWAIELAAQVSECPVVNGRKLVTRAQLHAVQRALRKLAAEGLVVAFGRLKRRTVWVTKQNRDDMLEGGLVRITGWLRSEVASRLTG